MLSSANYVKDEKVLNTGEQIAPDLNLKDPNVKVYYHQVKGAQTHLPDGAAIVFTGGQFSTANEDIIAYLDKVADKRGSMIYTRTATNIVYEVAQAAEDAKLPTGDAAQLNVPVSKETLAAVTATHERPKALPEQQKK